MATELDPESLFSDKLVQIVTPRWAGLISTVRRAGARDVLVRRRRLDRAKRDEMALQAPFSRLRDVVSSNCETVILEGPGVLAVGKKRYFQGARIRTLLIADDWRGWIVEWRIRRYERQKILTRLGKVRLGQGHEERVYHAWSVRPLGNGNRHAFYPPHWSPIEALNAIRHLRQVLLRSVEAVEEDRPFKDLDVLVDGRDVEALHEAYRCEIGLIAMDVYSSDGSAGHDFASVPYFLPRLASAALDSAELRESGVRAASPLYRYLTLVYHTLFHAKLAGHDPKEGDLSKVKFAKDTYLDDLRAAARAAALPQPDTVEDLEAVLKEHDYFPGTDLLTFYARRNPFVEARYLHGEARPRGLVTVYVRDFEDGTSAIDACRDAFSKHMEILHEQALEGALRERAVEAVRGGNWYDKDAGKLALPSHLLICFDHAAEPPAGKIARKYPHLDNVRIHTIKASLRTAAASGDGRDRRVVHSTDNSTEAVEHIKALGLVDKTAIRLRLEELNMIGKDQGAVV